MLWLFFSNLTMLVARVQLVKSGVFGLRDFVVCQVRVTMLVLPHYWSLADISDLQSWFAHEFCHDRLRQLTLGLVSRIEALTHELRLTGARHSAHRTRLRVIESQSQALARLNRERLAAQTEQAKLQMLAKVDHYNKKLLNTLKDPDSWRPSNQKIVLAKYNRDLETLRRAHE